MRTLPLFYIFVFLLVGPAMRAQSVLYCQFGNEYLPVESVKSGNPMCFTGDSLVKGNSNDLVIAPADQFGEGFIDIEIVTNKREGVIDNDGILQFQSPQGWYLLICRLIPDRDFSDCYLSLGLDRYGEKSFYPRSIGELKQGEEKSLRLYIKLGYEMPDQLHLFSGMEEIRTSLLPFEYSYDQGQLVFASN